MKVSLLQHAYARYLSQESRFTNYPLWRPFSKSFQKRRGRQAKAEGKGAFLNLCGVSVHRFLAKTVRAQGKTVLLLASSLSFLRLEQLNFISQLVFFFFEGFQNLVSCPITQRINENVSCTARKGAFVHPRKGFFCFVFFLIFRS